jgi:hypothetical protein
MVAVVWRRKTKMSAFSDGRKQKVFRAKILRGRSRMLAMRESSSIATFGERT